MPQPQIILQILEYLPSMILLHFSVRADACRHDPTSLQFGQVLLNAPCLWSIVRLGIVPGADSSHFHSSEEYPEDGVHICDQHLLEVQLTLSTLGARLTTIVPHLEDDHFLDLPVLALALVAGECLWLLVLILGDPVGCQGCMGLENDRSLTSALLG